MADIRLQAEIHVDGTTSNLPYKKEDMPCYYSGLIQQVPDKEFELLLGHSIPYGKWAGDLGVNDAICQMYYAREITCKNQRKMILGSGGTAYE